MGAGWVLWVGHCGWGMVSPTMEDTGPLKGQAWEEVPKILPMGTQSPSWEAMTSTGTAGGESGGRKSISSHKQPLASWLVTDSS